ncbi:MAG: radical SAM protein [Firmicutes bacterium]|nr:radical SAM protein [Bacillota bacterium]
MLGRLKKCELCPRKCRVNRLEGEIGYCRAGLEAKVALASLHYWEEPCISGTKGSGTVFFSHCNLRCLFCQNYQISQHGTGQEVAIARLSQIFLEQQDRQAHNLNLVTPVHYVPQIIAGLELARSNGFRLPVVYNTNSYETVETIRSLAGYVDVYLPDLKYYDDRYAIIYSGAPDYFAQATRAIEEMVSQVGTPRFDENGLIQKGVIIRHLALPGLLEDSKRIIEYVHHTFGNSVYFSLMNQYTPMFRAQERPEINQPLHPTDYEALIDYALSLGVENGFIQEDDTSSVLFVPKFDLRGV